MRGFFLLLLLTNLVFITWQYKQGEGKEDSVDIYHGINMVNQGLTLVSELPPEQQPVLREGEGAVKPAESMPDSKADGSGEGPVASAVQATTTPGDSKGQAPACYQITAIDSRQNLDKALKLLRETEASGVSEGETRVKRTNYWVMLPSYQQRNKADEAAAMLAAKGVKDFFIVRSGDYENAVSLGVFSTQERAERRYKEILALKARLRKPKIEAIELPAKQYSVNYALSGKASQQNLIRRLRGMNLPPAEEIRCK